MFLNTIMVVVLIVDVMLVYKLSVVLDRMEDDIVDIEITYTKMQNELRDLRDILECPSPQPYGVNDLPFQ